MSEEELFEEIRNVFQSPVAGQRDFFYNKLVGEARHLLYLPSPARMSGQLVQSLPNILKLPFASLQKSFYNNQPRVTIAIHDITNKAKPCIHVEALISQNDDAQSCNEDVNVKSHKVPSLAQ